MNRICKSCNKEIDEKNYLKDKTVWKKCYNENRRKNNINNNNTLIQNQQTNTIKSTITMTTTLMFQHTKITPMLLLA